MRAPLLSSPGPFARPIGRCRAPLPLNLPVAPSSGQSWACCPLRGGGWMLGAGSPGRRAAAVSACRQAASIGRDSASFTGPDSLGQIKKMAAAKATEIKALIDAKDMDGLARSVADFDDRQRAEIHAAFRAANGKAASEYLDASFKNGDYKDLMMIVLDDEIDVRCKLIKKAFKGGNDERCLTDTLLTTTPEIYARLKGRYHQLFGDEFESTLRKEIGSKTVWARMVNSWLAFCRSARNNVQGDAEALKAALIGNKHPDTDTVIRLLGTTVPSEWKQISETFENITKKTIEQALIEAYKGDDELALCCCNATLHCPARGAAYLLSLACQKKGDTDRCCRITGMLYDQAEQCKVLYAHYGNLAKDIRATMSKNLAEACCVLWHVM
ncbi:Alpha-7.2 giardin [Giardia lamblia P15]|uniref:Alpha-7.2 giardin n=1 Tax=Giardia intestinalis (strain P15) TaxID=658858 RepID=E1F8U2_GIAIA|nr:Alpha-7.2 giardin [Giardia lamblia P15]